MYCCRPTVAGIHGGPDGAYSIALSGGYDDNVDLGDGFTYTGEGGRDLKGTRTNPKVLESYFLTIFFVSILSKAMNAKVQLLSPINLIYILTELCPFSI